MLGSLIHLPRSQLPILFDQRNLNGNDSRPKSGQKRYLSCKRRLHGTIRYKGLDPVETANVFSIDQEAITASARDCHRVCTLEGKIWSLGIQEAYSTRFLIAEGLRTGQTFTTPHSLTRGFPYQRTWTPSGQCGPGKGFVAGSSQKPNR